MHCSAMALDTVAPCIHLATDFALKFPGLGCIRGSWHLSMCYITLERMEVGDPRAEKKAQGKKSITYLPSPMFRRRCAPTVKITVHGAFIGAFLNLHHL
jgi:hypothetical protein